MTITKPETAEYTECYVAFLDILGFSALVKQSESDPTVIPILVKVLNAAANLGEGSEHMRGEKTWRVQVRSFSDCVVIFVPTESHALPWLLSSIRYLHDRMLEMSCCIRGGVTIGSMYWSDGGTATDTGSKEVPGETSGTELPVGERTVWERGTGGDADIVLGPAHNEAYKLESELAIYPRVILSRKLMEHVRVASRWIPNSPARRVHTAVDAFPLCEGGGRLVSEFLRQDFDGLYHFDVLHKDIVRRDAMRIVQRQIEQGQVMTVYIWDDKPLGTFLADMQRFIEGQLAEVSEPKCRAKYLWLAKYFNASYPAPIDVTRAW